MPRRLDASSPDFADAYQRLIAVRGERLDAAEEAVRPILAAIRTRGAEAVVEYAAKFDGVVLRPEGLRVTAAEIDAAVAACPPDLIEALEIAAERIASYHRRQLPEDAFWTDEDGVTLGWRWTAVDAAGLLATYVRIKRQGMI